MNFGDDCMWGQDMLQNRLNENTVDTFISERQLVAISKKLNVVASIDIKGYKVEIRVLIERLGTTANGPPSNYKNTWPSPSGLCDKIRSKSIYIIFCHPVSIC